MLPAAVEASDSTTEASAASGWINGTAAGITPPGATLVFCGRGAGMDGAGMDGAGAVVVGVSALIDDMVKEYCCRGK